MNIRYAILTVTLALVASASRAKQPPITFARSGKTASVYLATDKDRPVQSVVLRAYGRVWTKPAKKAILIDKQDRANVIWLIDVPNVRVPAVFRITPVKDAKRTLGEVVAYPDRPVNWDKKTVLYATETPYWFNQWADTIGLPVTYILPGKLDGWRKSKDKDKKHLLIIGSKVAGKKFADTLAIAKKHKINVMVLEANWFGDKSGKVTVQPKQMAGGLVKLRKQKWSRPPAFRSHRKPWPGIANRWAWISDKEGLPLVEKLAVVSMPLMAVRPVILNYLPWEEQLGRSEQTDELLRATLAAAADSTFSGGGWRSLSVVHPKREKLDEKDRPVLTAAASGPIAFKDRPWTVHVLDVRGTDRLPEGLLEELKALERRVGADTESVLILGDDPLLDDWKWAKINRKKKKFKRGGIAWLPDDTLPPSVKNQIRLMLKLTEFGIPLKHPKPLKQEKKDEKPNK